MSAAEPHSVANLLWCFGSLVSADPSPVALDLVAEGGPSPARLRTRGMLALLRAAVRRIADALPAFSAYELSG